MSYSTSRDRQPLMSKKRVYLLGAAIMTGVLCVVTIPLLKSAPPDFSSEELERYDKTVADLDDAIHHKRIVNEEKTNIELSVFALKGLSNSPLGVWRELKLLLEKPHLSPTDLQNAVHLATNLGLLAEMFDCKLAAKQFDDLNGKLIHLKYRLKD